MALNDKKIRELESTDKAYRVPDGDGLYLDVRPTGAKFWRTTYRVGGKFKTKTIGKYPSVSIAAARAELHKLKADLENGTPIDGETRAGSVYTFGQLTHDWFDVKRKGWSDKYADRVWSRIEADALPALQYRDITTITPIDLLTVLRAMEKRGALDVSKRLRQQFEDMFAMAMVTGRVSSNPAAGLGRALVKSPRVRHRAALAVDQLPEFFSKMENADLADQTRLGLRLAIHTALRTGEIRFGKWSEIHGDQWVIPEDRMKMNRPHIVPLTKQVQEILAGLKKIAGDSEYILPNVREPYRPISENTLLFAVYRIGYYKRATVHGFRGTFSTHAHNSGQWKSEWIEKQLSHEDENDIRSAYNAAEYLDHRKKLMAWWSDLIEYKEEEGRLLS